MDSRNAGSRSFQVNSELEINQGIGVNRPQVSSRGQVGGLSRTHLHTSSLGGTLGPATRQQKSGSVTSSATFKSAMQVLKDMLLEPNSFSNSEVLLLIEQSGMGVDLKTSLAIARNFTENINGMKITIPNSKGVSDREKGKYLTDCVVNMIVQGGEVLVGVVATNYDLTEMAIESRAFIQSLENKRDSFTLDIVDPVPVNKEYYDESLADALETLKDELWYKYHRDFEERNTIEALEALSAEEGDGEEGQYQPPMWESSTEEVEFRVKFATEQSAIIKASRKKYLADTEEYQAAVKYRNEVRIKLANAKAELEKAQVLENRLSELTRQQNHIVSVLKSALGMSNADITKRLNMDVVVNGGRISAPYDNNNLSGIFQNLYNEYNKVSIHYFCDFLMKVLDQSMTSREADETPGAAVDKIAGFIQEYDRLQLDKHLTSDMLFTVALLKMYPAGSKAQRDGLQVVLEEAQAMERDPSRSDRALQTPWPDKHLFSTLAHWEKEIHGKSVEFSSTKATEKPTRPHSNVKDSVLEHANLAEQLTTPKDATGPYDREITRADNLLITVAKSGMKYPYVATKSQCHECPHIPRCTTFKCPKCNLIGHSAGQCHQRLPKPQGGGGRST